MRAHIIYHGEINYLGVGQVEQLCIELRDSISALTLHICSGGGNTNAGIGLFNFLTMMPFQIDTHCFGFCNSVAVNVFMAGESRTFVRGAAFSLHAASYTDGPEKGKIAEDVTKPLKRIFAEGLNWNEETLTRHFGTTKDTAFSGEDALNLKIATGQSQLVLKTEWPLFRVDPLGNTPIDLAFVRATAARARTSRPSSHDIIK